MVFEDHFHTGVKVADLMTKGVITIERNATLLEASKVMLSNDLDSLVIVRDEKPEGIITKSDILRWAINKDSLGNHRVDEAMTSPVKTISADFDAPTAIEHMRDNNITKIPVMKGGKIVGILTQSDMIRAIPGLFELIYFEALEERPKSEGEKSLEKQREGPPAY